MTFPYSFGMTTRLPFAFITSDENRMQEINGLTHPPHFSQFGHFLTETLTRIPISQNQIKQVLFHSYDGDSNYSKVSLDQKELLDLLNIVNVKIIDSPAVVINLKVQNENVVLNGSINESAVTVWRSIVKNAKIIPQKTNTKIFLSRSKLDKSLKRVNESYEAHYEDHFQQKGFEIIYPEELSINEQINIINSAKTIAGFSGSALHLSIFSEPGTKIIELGDKRSPQTSNTHQVNICRALGLIHEYHSYEVSM